MTSSPSTGAFRTFRLSIPPSSPLVLFPAEEQGRVVGRAVAALRALEAGPKATESDAVRGAARALAQMGAETASPEAFAEALWRAGGVCALYGLVSSRDLELSSLGIYAWAAAAGALSPGADELRRELLPAADIAARVFVAPAALEAPPPPKRPASAAAPPPPGLGPAPAPAPAPLRRRRRGGGGRWRRGGPGTRPQRAAAASSSQPPASSTPTPSTSRSRRACAGPTCTRR
eukprot:tig00000704_g3292.t1